MLRLIYTILLLSLSSTTLFSDDNNDNDSSSLSCESSEAFFCSCNRRHNTDNVYGPNLKVVTTPFRLTDCTIFSVGAEGGSNNIRFNGTFGYFLSPKIHFKCTAEQLSQRVTYNFTSGKLRKWMQQFAIGGVAQYAFCHPWIESIELYGSYANCPGRRLKSRPCCVQRTNLLNQVCRHIAGGRDGFAGLGITIQPWRRAIFSLAADYDYVTYRRKLSNRINTSGFGGTAKLHQEFDCGLSIDLKGELRRPFNYYEGALNWTNVHPFGILTFGVYTGYTQGRDFLPNNWTTGIMVSADFGGIPFFSNYRDCNPPPCVRGCPLNPLFPVDSELVAWIATPAVRMPTVLAISEEVVVPTQEKCPPPPKPHPNPPTPVCRAPISVTIPNQTSLPIDTAAFFDRNGHDMVFTAQGLPAGFTINPVTGVIRGNIFAIGTISVRVTGTTECGHTSQSFLIINEENPYGPYGPYGPYEGPILINNINAI
jgi:hypothetical protein